MRLVAHVIRADVRQFRWAILLWSLLVAADTAVTAVRPSLAADVRVYGNAGMIAGLLWSAQRIGLLLVVPLIVQAHPAVGTDAFWMTRPLPPRTVFAAKALLLATLTVLLPCAARLALMLWIHVPAREALLVTLDTGISSTAWLSVLMAGAAVTMNLPRFALLCGAVIVSFVLFVTLLIMRELGETTGTATATLMVGGSGQPVLPPDDDPTEGILFMLSVAVAGLGLAALQYRTRLRRVSVPASVGGLMLAVFAIPHWPIPLLKVPSALPGWSQAASAVWLRAASPDIEMDRAMAWVEGRDMLRSGRTGVIVSGLEPGWVTRLELLDATLTLDNGTTRASRGRGYQSAPQIEGSADHPWRVVARDVVGVDGPVSSPLDSEPSTIFVVPAKSLGAALPAHGRYRGDFAVRLVHWEAVAALPLRAGAAFQDAAYRFAIERVNAGPGDVMNVQAREWRATSSFDRKPMITYGFYARNAQHSRAMEGRETEPFGDVGAFSFGLPFVMGSAGPSRFFLRTAVISFPPYYGRQEQRIDWNPAWYADAELVIVRMTEAGAVLRTLDIPGASLVEKR